MLEFYFFLGFIHFRFSYSQHRFNHLLPSLRINNIKTRAHNFWHSDVTKISNKPITAYNTVDITFLHNFFIFLHKHRYSLGRIFLTSLIKNDNLKKFLEKMLEVGIFKNSNNFYWYQKDKMFGTKIASFYITNLQVGFGLSILFLTLKQEKNIFVLLFSFQWTI